MGLPDQPFYVAPAVREYFAGHKAALQRKYQQWQRTFEDWSRANPQQARQLDDAVADRIPDDLLQRIPEFAAGYADATRAAGGVVLQAVAQEVPWLLTGSADLFGSTKNYIEQGGDFGREDRTGRNLWFGIREHAMGAILNGIAYDGIFRPSGATFAVFADYLRPSIRLAALAHQPVVYIFTHDSVGVGEDGPTHQPVETCSGLRVIPGLDVIRPADPEETAGALAAALLRRDGPTALLLSRQKVPTLHDLPVETRRQGVLQGAYVALHETAPLQLILIATGSELQLALAAAQQLGGGVRVVSMPCCERFERQPADYRQRVLPAECTRRVAIEAGVPDLWHKYVGSQGQVVGISRFGLSAPGPTVMQELGISLEHLLHVVRAVGVKRVPRIRKIRARPRHPPCPRSMPCFSRLRLPGRPDCSPRLRWPGGMIPAANRRGRAGIAVMSCCRLAAGDLRRTRESGLRIPMNRQDGGCVLPAMVGNRAAAEGKGFPCHDTSGYEQRWLPSAS